MSYLRIAALQLYRNAQTLSMLYLQAPSLDHCRYDLSCHQGTAGQITYVGRKRSGKRGRGAEGKKPVLVAVESREKGAGFVAMKAVGTVSEATVRPFLSFQLKSGPACPNRCSAGVECGGRGTSSQEKGDATGEAAEWLPLVHIMIGKMKKFLNGTFHGVSSGYLQEYLDEFCYRFNRRFWEPELSLRLLNACLTHVPVKTAEFH